VDEGGEVLGDSTRAVEVAQEPANRLERLDLRAAADRGRQWEYEAVNDLSREVAEVASGETFGEVLEKAGTPPPMEVERGWA
jgi:hypothetical protein